VTVEAAIMKATDTITTVEGDEATRIFLETARRWSCDGRQFRRRQLFWIAFMAGRAICCAQLKNLIRLRDAGRSAHGQSPVPGRLSRGRWIHASSYLAQVLGQ
jgi:hypothetical protein